MLSRKKLQAAVVAVTAMALLAPLQPAAAEDRTVLVYGPAEYTRIEHVKIADLDLATRTGTKKLKARVGDAVERVCVFEPDIRSRSDYHACANGSWARAQPQIDRAVARATALALSGKPAAISAAIVVAAQ